MTTCQTLTLDFDEEVTLTRKLLERVPLDEAHRGYKPHPKSMPLDRLAAHVAEIPSWQQMIVGQDVLEMDAGYQPRVAASTAELLEMLDKGAAAGRAALATASDESLRKTWTFKYAGQVVIAEERAKVIRSQINHLVHHRAQLGVYLRLNGIAVPGMYGPSADDK